MGLLKLQLLKESIKIHRCVVTTVCILMDYFNNCNFSKLKLMRSLIDGVTVTLKYVGALLM